MGAEISPAKTAATGGVQPVRRASAAEMSLEQVRTREIQKFGDTFPSSRTRKGRSDSLATMTTEYFRRPPSQVPIHLSSSIHATPSPPHAILKMSPDTLNSELGNSTELVDSENSSGGVLGVPRPRLSRSPSAPAVTMQVGPPFPPDLVGLLDGEHHTDELCTRFSVGWPVLERWLHIVGGGTDDDDLGRVAVIYR